MNTYEVINSLENEKNRTQTGHTAKPIQFPAPTRPTKTPARAGRDSVAYWKTKVKPRIIRGQPTPELYARFFEAGREAWLCLDTSNRALAAERARDHYLRMKADGLPALLSALRPDPRPERSATIGELLSEAKAVATCRASTLNQYEVSMRRLVAGVLGMEATPETFYHRSEAAKQWRAKVEGASLDVLSAERVERWRKTYVAAAPDEIARAASKNSAASIIRNARALLAPAMIEAMKGKLRIPTPPPLSTLSIGGTVRRFKTSVKPRDMFDAAKAQLLGDPLAALVLCLFGGLRRGEVDMLPWSHVDLENGFVEVRTTPHFRPKTVESERITPLPAEALKILRKHRADAPIAEMVLTGLAPAVPRPVTKTRCKCWGPLRVWLRTQGFKTPNPIHELRKLSGSMINAAVGLEAARRHLGHRSIATTAGSYVTGSAAVIDLDAK